MKLTAIPIFALLIACSAIAANQTLPPNAKKSIVALDPVPGSPAKRIVLTPKAVERLGIEVGKVGQQAVVYKQMVSGVIVDPNQVASLSAPSGSGGFSGFQTAQLASNNTTAQQQKKLADNEVWILVSLSKGEWDRLAKDKPARIFALSTREKLSEELLAIPSGMEPIEDLKRSMLTTYYVVQRKSKESGLPIQRRMRVELQMTGGGDNQTVVPYSAIYYDGKGVPWVYLNPKPNTFERKRVTVERVVGNHAILADGPPVETTVVTTGAALLYGVEIFGK